MSNTLALFKDLSSELIIQILHCCEYTTILRFAATARAYYSLVTQSTSLQLHIELEANGLELVKGSFKRNATYTVILEDLKQFHKAWLDLDMGIPIVRPVGKTRMLLWELREGFYIKAFSQSEGRHADALQFIPLDLKTPDPPPLLFDISFDEFTVDPEQGLIAIVSKNLGLFTTIHVDLYSITTGLAHPHAQYPRLTVEFEFERPFFSPELDIEIMGNVLLIKASHSRLHAYELLIWDWRSGIFLNRITTRQGICDFTFLDKQHLVVLSGTRSDPDSEALGTLELLVYTISDGISTCSNLLHGQLRVADLVVSQPTLRLAFPQIQESCTISDTEFYLRSDPIPGRILYTHSAAYACSYTTTLSINFYVRNVNTGWEGPDYYRVFLDGRFLMDQLRTYNSNETVHVPWSSWGVCATRWFITTERPNHWICRISSSRFISQLSDQPYYCILDFSSANAGRSRGCALQSNPPGLDGLDVTKDSGLGVEFEGLRRLEQDLRHFPADSPAGHELLVATVGADNPGTISGIGFEEPITSRLPYRIVCRMNNQSDHEGWQINGDCIVGVAVRFVRTFPTHVF